MSSLAETEIEFRGQTFKVSIEVWKSATKHDTILAVDRTKGENYGDLFGLITINTDHKTNDNEIVVNTHDDHSWTKQLLTLLPDLFQDTGKRIQTGFTTAEIWTMTP